jgi:hypothetical protein
MSCAERCGAEPLLRCMHAHAAMRCAQCHACPHAMHVQRACAQVRLMIGEFKSSNKPEEAALSGQEIVAAGAAASAIQAMLLCELTSVHKDLVKFQETRALWAQVRTAPLPPTAACAVPL